MDLVTASGKGSENQQKEKLVITEEHFQRVARSLIMRLRQHEETVVQDGIPDYALTVFLIRGDLYCYGSNLNCMPC